MPNILASIIENCPLRTEAAQPLHLGHLSLARDPKTVHASSCGGRRRAADAVSGGGFRSEKIEIANLIPKEVFVQVVEPLSASFLVCLFRCKVRF